MQMPGRKYTQPSAKYRYGFNGKENDNDVKGEGSQQDYGFRIYDPRIGKFLSVDPLTKDFPELTPYQFSSNSPIENIDLDGLESISGFQAAQARKFESQTQLALAKPKPREIEIMVWNPYRNQAQIGKASVVMENIAIARNNYNNAIAANISGGFFGAMGYMVGGDKGSFVGAAADGVAMSFGGIPAGKSSVLSKPTNVPQTRSVPKTEMPLFNQSAGAGRASKYSSEWGSASLSEAIQKFAPNALGIKTATGKTIYKNAETGIQLIADNGGNYFRIQNTNMIGKRNYLGLDGSNLANKVVGGKTSGRSEAEYNQVTHFNNSDKK